jgi:lysophospholipase L1-like esterase
MNIKPNSTLLFQGDSITDCGRLKSIEDQAPQANNNHCLGFGYAGKIAGKLLSSHPGLRLTIHNRGVSGNRITNMADRWSHGFEALKPDVVSILIGVNDTWHGVAKGTPENGVGLEEYEKVYRKLLEKLKKNFPEIQLVLCEPFSLNCGAVSTLNFYPDIDLRRQRAKAVADDYADVWVPFQSLFDSLCDEAPAEHWVPDGVHPSPAGHERMSDFWLQHVLG